MDRTPIGHALGLLSRFSGSDTAERFGLNKHAKTLLYHGVRTSMKAGALARSRFRPLRELLPEEGLKRFRRSKTGLFDLTMTEEQRLTDEVIGRFAAERLRPLGQQADDDLDVPPEVLREVQSLGINLMAIPEAAEGAASVRSPISNLLVAEKLAHGDMGLALASLAPLAFINTLTEFGSRAQQARYLPSFTGEEFLKASLALMEPRARFNPERLTTKAIRTRRGFRLTGEKCLVPLGVDSEVVIVFAWVPGQGARGFIVHSQTPGVTWKPERNMGLRSAGLSRMSLDDVEVRANALLGEAEVQYDHQRMTDLSRLGLCALAVGTCQAVIDYVIPYCNERVAFGEPISHRQSIAFMIADMVTELEGMRLLTYRAASRAEQGLDFHREAFLARVLCGDKAMEIGTSGVQLLGGHGFTCEHPVELWYRQLRAVGLMEGGLLI